MTYTHIMQTMVLGYTYKTGILWGPDVRKYSSTVEHMGYEISKDREPHLQELQEITGQNFRDPWVTILYPMCMYKYVYMYIYICIYIYVYVCIYVGYQHPNLWILFGGF